MPPKLVEEKERELKSSEVKVTSLVMDPQNNSLDGRGVDKKEMFCVAVIKRHLDSKCLLG